MIFASELLIGHVLRVKNFIFMNRFVYAHETSIYWMVITYANIHNIAVFCPNSSYIVQCSCDNARQGPPYSLLSTAASNLFNM